VDRDLISINDRVAWAIDRSQRTLENIADEIGCSHATLSFWANGQTNMEKAKVGLVTAFCRTTGVHLEWLLTGNGPRLSAYPKQEHELVRQARHIVEDAPNIVDTAMRVLNALETAQPH
jgi:transcriptional regulator with XRE-family HTH domain